MMLHQTNAERIYGRKLWWRYWARKDARNIKASFTVIEEDCSSIHYNDENDGFSPPRKRRSQSKNKTKKITKNVSSSKCDNSPNEASFDDLSQAESSENVTSDE